MSYNHTQSDAALRVPGQDKDELLATLADVREAEQGWSASCPVHAGDPESLSIGREHAGHHEVRCSEGCSADTLARVLGLDPSSEPGPEADTNLSAAKSLVDVALQSGVQLFHDASARAYVRVPIASRHEVWALSSRRFKQWLRHRHYTSTGRVAKNEAINEAFEFLTAMAQFDGPEKETFLRSAWIDDRSFVYNLADLDGRCVRVSSGGWSVDDETSVAFLRKDTVLPMPAPEAGGSIERLRRYVNPESEEDFVLIVGWAVMSLRPVGPFPVLVFQGEQGSGKSTAMRVLKTLLDPVKAPIRSAPGSERDLVIAAESNSVIAVDNVSTLTTPASDALCRLSTGGGFATRALYTDDEERVFEQMRAIAVNGIDAVATRQDLLDRAIVVRSPRITSREDEATLWSAFETDRPTILGALLDGSASALANWDQTPRTGTRMADFERWAAASMLAFGWSPDTFRSAYERNRSKALRASLDGSVLTRLIERLVGQHYLVEGAPTHIYKALANQLEDNERRTSGFPRSPQAMSKQLTLLAPALREIGIDFLASWSGSGNDKRRHMVLTRMPAGGGTPGTDGTQPPHGEDQAA